MCKEGKSQLIDFTPDKDDELRDYGAPFFRDLIAFVDPYPSFAVSINQPMTLFISLDLPSHIMYLRPTEDKK